MPAELQFLLVAFSLQRARFEVARRSDSGASGIETAIISAILAGIAITIAGIIVTRITSRGECIASGTETCA